MGNQASRSVSFVASPLVGEALAILADMHHAVELGFFNLFIASDSTAVIKATTSKSQSKELQGILHNISDLASKFVFLSFNFIPRNSNRHADALAKAGLRAHVAPV